MKGADGGADGEKGSCTFVCGGGLIFILSKSAERGVDDEGVTSPKDPSAFPWIAGGGSNVCAGGISCSLPLPIIGRRPSRSALMMSTALNLQ